MNSGVRFSPRARADLDEIAGYITPHNPVRAASFVSELEAVCEMAGINPRLYPARPDLGPSLRMAVHGQYLVIYRHLESEELVRIERILHGARDLGRLF